MRDGGDPPTLELAGPRHEIFFNPADTCCAIVTCGGLCPGINDVIRAIVMQAYYVYGVRRILGIQYGYEGLDPAHGHKPIELTPEEVRNISYFGGSFLGSSRGRKDTKVMVNRLEALGVNILFVIGGDGSQRGAHDIYEEVQPAGRAHRHRRRAQDHRQRPDVHGPELRLSDRLRGGLSRGHRRAHRGPRRAQRRGSGEADGP